MTAEDMTMEALREELSRLEIRVKELGTENRDLREICDENGVDYEERLAARRHKRYFAQLCAKHPIGKKVEASDVLGAAPAVRGIAACAGFVLRTALNARCFVAAFTYVTAHLPRRFGGRSSVTFEGHDDNVMSLAALEGGRLASGSDDRIIKIWEHASREAVT